MADKVVIAVLSSSWNRSKSPTLNHLRLTERQGPLRITQSYEQPYEDLHCAPRLTHSFSFPIL
eukprot:scaffold219772_cov17-Tisochrysis_lutea.AAC.1